MTQPSFDFDAMWQPTPFEESILKKHFTGQDRARVRLMFQQFHTRKNQFAAQAVKAKDEGMALAANNRAELLDIARAIARHLATTVHADRCVDAEDVAYVLSQRGYPSLGNAAGSLFRNRKEWRFTGRWRNSTRVTSHARTIRIWEFIGA
tara:strand:- start:535 stop:984 length:450 start_codon:yes stop_codon:yes gene_type:complete